MSALRTIVPILATLASLAGCDAKKAPEQTSAPSTSASADAEEARCHALKASFRSTLAQSASSCSTDADCTCGPGGVEPAGCGRVMNLESAKKLFRIYDEVRESCGLDFQCAPQRCLTACQNGGCVKRAQEPGPVQPTFTP